MKLESYFQLDLCYHTYKMGIKVFMCLNRAWRFLGEDCLTVYLLRAELLISDLKSIGGLGGLIHCRKTRQCSHYDVA